jgi:hypothetical protein
MGRVYLSSPFCVVWIDDATPKMEWRFGGGGRVDGRQAVGGVCGHVRFGNGCGIGCSSATSKDLVFYRQPTFILIFVIQFVQSPGCPKKDLTNIAPSPK